MDQVEFKIGELTARFEEALRRFDKNDNDHASMQREIRSLNVWRWKVIGVVLGLSGIVQGIFMVIKIVN